MCRVTQMVMKCLELQCTLQQECSTPKKGFETFETCSLCNLLIIAQCILYGLLFNSIVTR